MVLTGYLTDKNLYNGELLDMLKTEKKITSRINSLPDVWSFSKQDFHFSEIDTGRIIFGASEYIKDGLIPLVEYIGKSPWQERMMEMLDDLLIIMDNPDDLTKYFERTASVEEVNGEMLQTLSRIYWMTGDKKYLEYATNIGDYYLLGNRDLSQIEYLRIRDHGCEIIGGLSELYVTLHFANPEKKKAYTPALHKLLDRVLEIGRNEDGLFYNAVNAKTGEIIDNNTVDNWGYVFDAQRHKTILNLPIDYPRINQFPEWFVAKEGKMYSLASSQKELSGEYLAKELLEGIPLKINAGEQVVFHVLP